MAESRTIGARLADFASRARSVAQRLGWTHLFLWFCAALGRRVSLHIFVVMTHPIGEGKFVNTTGLEARFLTAPEIEHYASEEGYRYSRAFAADALSRGHRCFGVLEGERLRYYCWIARGPAPVFDDVEVAVDPPLAYGYNAYTDPTYRGRGLHTVAVEAIGQALHIEGFRGVAAYIEADNLAPIMAAHRMGEHRAGLVVLWRLFGKFRWYASPGCGKSGFRVGRAGQRLRVAESDFPS